MIVPQHLRGLLVAIVAWFALWAAIWLAVFASVSA